MSRRYGHDLSLLLVDLDGFRLFNQTFGRDRGDAALVEVAGILRDVTRAEVDILARYGRDEFLIILPQTRANDPEPLTAATVATRVHERLDAHRFESAPGQRDVAVTVSIGVAGVGLGGYIGGGTARLRGEGGLPRQARRPRPRGHVRSLSATRRWAVALLPGAGDRGSVGAQVIISGGVAADTASDGRLDSNMPDWLTGRVPDHVRVADPQGRRGARLPPSRATPGRGDRRRRAARRQPAAPGSRGVLGRRPARERLGRCDAGLGSARGALGGGRRAATRTPSRPISAAPVRSSGGRTWSRRR